jgi:5-methylcytosine-specific restriction endonuclease McrA
MKEYSKKHYADNMETYKARTIISNRRIRKRNRDFLIAIKESSPCMDCGKFFPYYVMHFDHIFEKNASIADLSRSCVSVERLQQEVDNCELVCSNCHAIRTHERKQGDEDMSEWV